VPVPPALHRPSALAAATAAAVACALAAASPAPAAAKEASFTSPPEIVLDPTSGPEDVALGDFNLDGKQDLAVTDFKNDAVHVRLGNGDGSFKEADSIGGVDEPEALVVGDFNLDGVEDLAVGITVQGNGYIAVLTGLGDGKFSRGPLVSLPSTRPRSPWPTSTETAGTISRQPASAVSACVSEPPMASSRPAPT
jgi:hypothetical protein